MKKVLFAVAVSLAVFLPQEILAIGVTPVKDFSGWDQLVYFETELSDTEFNFRPGSFDLSLKGNPASPGFTSVYPTTTAKGLIGILANVKVDGTKGNVAVGFLQTIGASSKGRHYKLFIFLYDAYGVRHIKWSVRDRANDDISDEKIISEGFFGGPDNQWSVGETVTFGYVILNNEVWLYVNGYGCFHKWQPFDVLKLKDMNNPGFFLRTDTGTSNSVSVDVSNVFLVTP